MSRVVFIHAHGEGKSTREVQIRDGKVSKRDVKDAINSLFNSYDKKVRNNQSAERARDKLIRFVDNAGTISGKGMGQNTYSSESFNDSDLRGYHMDIEFDTEVTFS